jgi:protoheme ferro-lyase
MTAFLALSLLAFAGVILVVVCQFKKKRLLPSVLALLVFVSAYLVTDYLFLNQEIPHQVPELTRSTEDPGKGHTAVIYFTHGEPKNYSVNAWIETMRHLDADKVPFVPKPFRPFFFNGVRSEYLEVGESRHNQIHAEMIASLAESMLSQDDPSLKFYLSFLDTDPRPDAAVIEALNDGASQIILMPVFLTISSHTAEGIKLLEAVDLESFDVPMCIADPMWESESLKRMFINRANNNLGDSSKSDVGIMLVGHGQPEEWDVIYPTQTEQENSFREAIRVMLIQDGYSPENIALSWMDFKSPEVGEGALEVYQNGITSLMIFPAPISADSIHTDIEIPAAIEEAGVPDGVEVHFLGAWNNDPYVIEGIRQNILACMP